VFKKRRAETESGSALWWILLAMIVAFGLGAAFIFFNGLGTLHSVSAQATSAGSQILNPPVISLTINGQSGTIVSPTRGQSAYYIALAAISGNSKTSGDSVVLSITYALTNNPGGQKTSAPLTICSGNITPYTLIFTCTPGTISPNQTAYLQATDQTSKIVSNVVTLQT
jgi:hypothetical protein